MQEQQKGELCENTKVGLTKPPRKCSGKPISHKNEQWKSIEVKPWESKMA